VSFEARAERRPAFCARRHEASQVGTKKCLPAELRNGQWRRDRCVACWRLIVPGRSASNHGIGEDEHLPRAGNKRLLEQLQVENTPEGHKVWMCPTGKSPKVCPALSAKIF
jgi:hypothetical protein